MPKAQVPTGVQSTGAETLAEHVAKPANFQVSWVTQRDLPRRWKCKVKPCQKPEKGLQASCCNLPPSGLLIYFGWEGESCHLNPGDTPEGAHTLKKKK